MGDSLRGFSGEDRRVSWFWSHASSPSSCRAHETMEGRLLFACIPWTSMVASTVVDGLHAFNGQEDHTEPRCVQCSPDASIILQTLHLNPVYPGLGHALPAYLVEARLLCQLLALLCCGGHSAPAIPEEVQHLHGSWACNGHKGSAGAGTSCKKGVVPNTA